jgi:SAM-dependent methyltransferase
MRTLEVTELPSFFSEADVEKLSVCACGSGNTEPMYAEFGLRVEVCRDCGIARTNPRLKQSAIQRFYEESASGQRVFPTKPGSARIVFPWRDATVRYRGLSKQLRRMFPEKRVPKLLEVGFGGGDFIAQLRSAGFEVHGFDISATAVEKLRQKGMEATCAESLKDAAFPKDSFDMIVMWEVFEHIPDPVSFANEIFRILKPGGFWFLQVPNWRWINFKTRLTSRLPGRKAYLSKYGYIGPLFHLYHYTHESLSRLLTKSGLRFHSANRIRPYGEANWTALIAHEAFYALDSIPAMLSGNRNHLNVVLCELYQKPAA